MLIERLDVSTGLADHFKECLSELDNSVLQKEQLESGKEEQVPANLIQILAPWKLQRYFEISSIIGTDAAISYFELHHQWLR